MHLSFLNMSLSENAVRDLFELASCCPFVRQRETEREIKKWGQKDTKRSTCSLPHSKGLEENKSKRKIINQV